MGRRQQREMICPPLIDNQLRPPPICCCLHLVKKHQLSRQYQSQTPFLVVLWIAQAALNPHTYNSLTGSLTKYLCPAMPWPNPDHHPITDHTSLKKETGQGILIATWKLKQKSIFQLCCPSDQAYCDDIPLSLSLQLLSGPLLQPQDSGPGCLFHWRKNLLPQSLAKVDLQWYLTLTLLWGTWCPFLDKCWLL